MISSASAMPGATKQIKAAPYYQMTTNNEDTRWLAFRIFKGKINCSRQSTLNMAIAHALPLPPRDWNFINAQHGDRSGTPLASWRVELRLARFFIQMLHHLSLLQLQSKNDIRQLSHSWFRALSTQHLDLLGLLHCSATSWR